MRDAVEYGSVDRSAMERSADHGLSRKVAIVTGSNRGIGFAVARLLAQEGATVVINGRDELATKEAAERIHDDGGTVIPVVGTSADPDVVERMVDVATERFRRIDILINCVGIAEPTGSSILNISIEQWTDLINAHLTSAFLTCRAVAPLMVNQGGGAIVNTSSHAFMGIFGGTGYPAGKGGVNSLTMALAAELREHHVRVNAVCPGASTRLSSGDDYVRHIEDLHQRGLLDDATYHGALSPAPPEYVARLYAFLASDLAATISGDVFVGSGCYIGRFPRPEPTFITWRDHLSNEPWTLREIADLCVRSANEC